VRSGRKVSGEDDLLPAHVKLDSVSKVFQKSFLGLPDLSHFENLLLLF